MKVAIYARVSTDRDNQSVDKQVDELKAYCKRQGWLSTVFTDEKRTGGNTKRSGFQSMMEAAKEKKFDVVLVTTISRLSRSVIDFSNTIKQLDGFGIRFIACRDNIDTDKSSPTAALLMHILSAFAEFERAIIRERILAGVARRRAAGLHIGPRPMEDLRVGYLLERHKAGDSLREIRRKYKDKFGGKGVSIETIRKYLKLMQPGEK